MLYRADTENLVVALYRRWIFLTAATCLLEPPLLEFGEPRFLFVVVVRYSIFVDCVVNESLSYSRLVFVKHRIEKNCYVVVGD